MKKLLSVLILSLAASTAFAEEKGNITVNVMNAVKMASVKVNGSAAASLYKLLDVSEVQSKTRPGAMMKEGNNITCYMWHAVVGNGMISPVVQMYDCSLIVTSDGSIESDKEVGLDG
ncbi:MAG: hypothetical protein ABIQ95_00155 [Bdellovibrionia bacterium]